MCAETYADVCIVSLFGVITHTSTCLNCCVKITQARVAAEEARGAAEAEAAAAEAEAQRLRAQLARLKDQMMREQVDAVFLS